MDLDTSRMVAFSQITEGEATCDMCGAPAEITLSCEPDYDDTPMCWVHGRQFVRLALDAGDRFWG